MASIAKQKLGNKKDFQVHQKAQEIGKIVNETELRFSNQNSVRKSQLRYFEKKSKFSYLLEPRRLS